MANSLEKTALRLTILCLASAVGGYLLWCMSFIRTARGSWAVGAADVMLLGGLLGSIIPFALGVSCIVARGFSVRAVVATLLSGGLFVLFLVGFL